MNIEAEIRDLKRRVGELEGSFGFLTQQLKSVHRDLLAFQEKTEQRFDEINGRFDKIDGRFDKVDSSVNRIDKEIKDLRRDIPGIVAETMRDVLDKRRDK